MCSAGEQRRPMCTTLNTTLGFITLKRGHVLYLLRESLYSICVMQGKPVQASHSLRSFRGHPQREFINLSLKSALSYTDKSSPTKLFKNFNSAT